MPDFSLQGTVVHYDEADVVRVNRTDFLGRKLGKIQKTDEGYLTGTAPVAKIGVMSYVLNDGSIRRELVPHETLFNTDSMASLKMKPVTDSHPPERILDSKTVKRRKVGFTGETIKQDGDYLTSTVTITDDDAVSNVNQGRQELSPGYTCELLMRPGTFNGDAYDAIQVKRQYNHLALCDKARGGSELRLNFDSATHCDGFEVKEDTLQAPDDQDEMDSFLDEVDSLLNEDEDIAEEQARGDAAVVHLDRTAALRRALRALAAQKRTNRARIRRGERPIVAGERVSIRKFISATGATKKTVKNIRAGDSHLTEGAIMPILKLDGIDYEAAQQVVNHVAKLDTQITGLTKDLDVMKADRDTSKEKLDTAEKQIKEVPAQIAAGVRTRLDLERKASAILPKETLEKIDSMSDVDIRKAVILVKFPEAKLDGQSEDYLKARFDAALEVVTKTDDADAANRAKSAPRQDSDNTDCNSTEAARGRMMKRMRGEKVDGDDKK